MPDYEDLLLSVELTKEAIPILTASHTSYRHEARAQVPELSTSSPRAFEQYESEQDMVNFNVKNSCAISYSVEKVKFKPPEGDTASSYIMLSLPINSLYINGLQLFESYHLTYTQALNQHFQTRFGDTISVMLKRIDDTLNDSSKYAIRFEKYLVNITE